MKIIGMLSTVLGAVVLAGGALLFVRSLPELRRYLKVRNM
jgi:hypothetical protein